MAFTARNKTQIPNKQLKTKFNVLRDTSVVIIKFQTHVKTTYNFSSSLQKTQCIPIIKEDKLIIFRNVSLLVYETRKECGKWENPLLLTIDNKITINLNYISIFNPYRAVNTRSLSYKNQSVNVV